MRCEERRASEIGPRADFTLGLLMCKPTTISPRSMFCIYARERRMLRDTQAREGDRAARRGINISYICTHDERISRILHVLSLKNGCEKKNVYTIKEAN